MLNTMIFIHLLFRIKILSLETLEAYLNKISIIDNHKFAHLMLAAFMSKSIEGSDNRHFLSNIINRIRNISQNNSILNDCSMKNKYIENNELIRIIRHIENNELIRIGRFKSVMNNSQLVNFPRYLEIWLGTILNTNQLHILDKMYFDALWYNNYRHAPYIPWEQYMKKYIIYDYVKSGLVCTGIKKDTLMNEDKQIKRTII